MESICSFILVGGFSASGYFAKWETDGKLEYISSPFKGRDEGIYMRLEIRPGNYIFLHSNENTVEEEGEEEMLLIQVPANKEQFRMFKEKAELVAGDSIYDRINGYKKAKKGPYDYSEDFSGEWLKHYVLLTFKPCSQNHPKNLEEAIDWPNRKLSGES